ncbi:MAG TPA: N-acetylmuramoyl-L-alanine amidase [Burkholderiales bacterium]|nr:N-acetylmuramoyl-L-alanine amidase [Burkholderiales bacterium]
MFSSNARGLITSTLDKALLAICFLIFPLIVSLPVEAATQVSSVRVWPAQDYTRLTIESNAPITYNLFTVKNPERLVLDLENIELNGALNEISEKISAGDPYIKQVRVGNFKPRVVRVVLDLKAEVKPQIFALQPIGDYGHRLVLDIYPAVPVDPLMALVQKSENKLAQQNDTSLPGEKTGEPSDPVEATRNDAVNQPKTSEKPRIAGGRHDNNANQDVTRLITIAIDPGHGGEDPGARGRSGTREKNVTLAIARKVKARIDQEPNMRSMLTRDGDYFIDLQERVHKAQKIRADLFISIHADAFIRPNARGSSVYALSERGATSAAARWLANSENQSDLIGGVNLNVRDPYLKKTLLDLAQTATINDSVKLGKSVLSELGSVNELHRYSVEQAGFAVLKAPDIPSILVETAFISNPEEETRLKDETYQNKIADAIVEGIKRYFANNPPIAKSKLAQVP